jgi:hypothetical protein
MTQPNEAPASRLPALPSTSAVPARVSQATAVEQTRAVAEVQAAVMVAQANPRNVFGAYAAMRSACARLYLAERAAYSVVNRGRGPTIHLARELARIWGNLDNGVRELRRDDDVSEVLAYAWDQEANVRTSRSFIVPHQRMVNVNGTPTRRDLFDLQDIYLNNQNVGARALRECIFALLPAEYVDEAIRLCAATVKHGDGVPLEKRIENMIGHYAGLGVRVRQIEERVGRRRGQWTAEDVAELAIVNSSIQRGDTTARDEFPPEPITVTELHASQTPPAPATPTTSPAGSGPAGTTPKEKPWQTSPSPSPTTPAPTASPTSPAAPTGTTPTPEASAKTPRKRPPSDPDPVVEDPPDWPDVPTIPGAERWRDAP